MIIELRRTLTPEDMGPAECAICRDEFEVGTVTAWVYTGEEGGGHVGASDPFGCPACVEALGAYRSERFPTAEEYRRLEAEWRTPYCASGEEANAAWLAEYERREQEATNGR